MGGCRAGLNQPQCHRLLLLCSSLGFRSATDAASQQPDRPAARPDHIYSCALSTTALKHSPAPAAAAAPQPRRRAAGTRQTRRQLPRPQGMRIAEHAGVPTLCLLSLPPPAAAACRRRCWTVHRCLGGTSLRSPRWSVISGQGVGARCCCCSAQANWPGVGWWEEAADVLAGCPGRMGCASGHSRLVGLGLQFPAAQEAQQGPRRL